MAKRVYLFGNGITEGDSSKINLLGCKGIGLAELAKKGFNVPPGFTITTEVCATYYKNKHKIPVNLYVEVKKAVSVIEKKTGKQFGGNKNPLLVAVRSGARESMPGMMDTILNIGLNDLTVEALKEKYKNGRFAYDSYRRFIQMYSNIVLHIECKNESECDPFEAIISEACKKKGFTRDNQLTEEDLKVIVENFKKLVLKKTGKIFPNDPYKQLEGAIGAVFTSWMNVRSILYRNKYKIPEELGTAVNVQSMVFGNLNDSSCTGVAFTRNPSTGEDEIYGEFLVNAQGEDVLAGIYTPLKIMDMATTPHLEHCFKELCEVRKLLEKEFGDMQEFEFTIEDSKLYILQTRNGKRTARSYIKIAHDMVKQKLMTQEYAIESADPESIEQLLAPVFNKEAYQKALNEKRLLTKGLPAGIGSTSGILVFTSKKAERLSKHGPVILARIRTCPEDLHGMFAASGIVISKGGVSSHAALVVRQMGKVCVMGASDIKINYKTRTLNCGDKIVKEGEFISINGSTGEVFNGKIDTAPSELVQILINKTLDTKKSKLFTDYDFIMKLSDKYRKLGIYANADQPEQASNAMAFGAEGIGVCRTEHMFFKDDRIDYVRKMIIFAKEYAEYKAMLAQYPDDALSLEEKYHSPIMHFRNALEKLLPIQQEDFEKIFKVMGDRPVTIRYLDPPLYEFIEISNSKMIELANKLKVHKNKIKQAIDYLDEDNPMLGHRGCRLGIVYPEISEMQSRALFRAALAVAAKTKKLPKPEIMIPLVGFERELKLQLDIINQVAKEEFAVAKRTIEYKVGTMIEIPRAAITADKIAKHAQFFSFGTNDLTQTVLGMSRDDSDHFLPFYENKADIIKSNPFATLDQEGVGELMEIAIQRGKKTRPNIKIGICGEHGGDPASIEFCHNLGLDYVSCSPFRIPVARIAAAKAAVIEMKNR